MEVDVCLSLKKLIQKSLPSDSNCKRSGICSAARINKLKKKIYEILLSHHDSEQWGNAYDQLYAECYKMKLSFKNGDKLNSLVESLQRLDCLEIRRSLTLIINLSNLDEKVEPTTCSVLKSISHWNLELSNESNNNHLSRKSANWFEMPAAHVEIKETRMVQAAPNFFQVTSCSNGNLTECSKSYWADGHFIEKLEIPELSEDYDDQTYRFPRLNLKTSANQVDKETNFKCSGKIDVDEGFEETITPSSAVSVVHKTNYQCSWDIIASEAFCETHPQIWECLGSVDPLLEKPLLTEASTCVVDNVIGCHLSDLYVVCPEIVDYFRKTSLKVDSELTTMCVLQVLVAVPSVIFTYNKDTHSFMVESVVLPGVSPRTLFEYLKPFASCGSYHFRLEEVVDWIDSNKQSGLVLKALGEGIRHYLQHARTVVTALHIHSDLYQPCLLLRLKEDTANLRQLTTKVAKLLNLSDGWHLDSLPTGFCLLKRIYHSAISSLFNPVFISLFKWSLQPYLLFLHDWAFEGRSLDQHGEFPIKPNLELFLSITDEKWWSEGYVLEEVEDLILGPDVLSQVFLCGKTLIILRNCCPLHPLFSMTPKRPRFTLELIEASVQLSELEWKAYFEVIDALLQRFQCRINAQNDCVVSGSSNACGLSFQQNCDSHDNDPQDQKPLDGSLLTEGDISDRSLLHLSYRQTENVKVNVENDNEGPNVSTGECAYKASPYTYLWPHRSDSLIIDNAERFVKVKSGADTQSGFGGIVLPAMIRRCIAEPLIAQVSLVNRITLDYVLQNLKLKKCFTFFANHFFMQDGEFSQSLCNLLFTHLMNIERPEQLINRMTLNSILDEACSQSIGQDNSCLTQFRANLSFSVKYVPNNFRKNSVTVLECLRLTHRVEWPITFVITAEAHRHYQYIFNFLLQLRLCLWSLSEIYHILKISDPSAVKYQSVSSRLTMSRYRHVQFYRQDMLHFIKSVHEHLNLMAFQRSLLKFQEEVERVKSIDDLIASHNAYLKKVAFRCLLTKVAAPLMKILKDVFTSVLEFHSWLLGEERQEVHASIGRWNDENVFNLLTKTYKDFKKHSSLLSKAAITMAQKGYQPRFASFLMQLRDCDESTQK